jgi:hypothetical protein
MAIATAFYEGPRGLGESGGPEDEMDTDHFNELDRIFDLPYGAEQDPFGGTTTTSNSSGSSSSSQQQQQQTQQQTQPTRQSAGQAQQGHYNSPHGAAGLLMPQPHGSSSGPGQMDWHVKEEDASYHTAVDASCHVDASYHRTIDASSHSMVDASGHSMMDASGHDSLIDSSGHYDEYAAHKGDPRYMEHSCEACKRSKVGDAWDCFCLFLGRAFLAFNPRTFPPDTSAFFPFADISDSHSFSFTCYTNRRPVETMQSPQPLSNMHLAGHQMRAPDPWPRAPPRQQEQSGLARVIASPEQLPARL